MTMEEAIEILQSGAGIWPMTDRANNALNKAIKALEQEPCEDAISRQAAISDIQELSRCESNSMDAFTRTIQGGKRGSMTNEEAVKYFKRHIDLYCVTGICRDAEIMAIKALSQQIEYHGTEDMEGLYYCPICQQTTTAVKDGKCPKCGATMDELSTRAQQTEDAISRESAIDTLCEGISCYDCSFNKWGNNDMGCLLKERIRNMPSVTLKQRTGHWIMSDDGLYRPICNNCGAHPWKGYIPTVEEATKAFKYCPTCGIKMVEPQESEDKNE